jgi:lysophospholipase L1-like esterase
MRQLGLGIACAALLVACQSQSAGRWIRSWGASPAPAQPAAESVAVNRVTPTFDDQTIVQTVRLSAGGQRLRLRLTNEYGKTPLAIGAAKVAVVGADGQAGPWRPVTFSGKSVATIAPGAPFLSDAVDLPTGPLSTVKVALYVQGKAVCTCHFAGLQRAEVSPTGDYTDRPFTSAIQGSWRAFLSGVEVESSRIAPVIVTFGDSITDGTASTEGANKRWPDRLAERLQGRAGIVNAGIAGNRVLADATPLLFGQSALVRFDRDVLSVPGATHLIILEGVNDLGQGGANPPSAEALIGGYRQLIVRAQAKGIKVIGATILPYEGARYFRAEGDAVRQQVNTWIRTGGEFDGVIDFDAAVRDPANPKRLLAEYQSGDWLHPSDAGYRVMGDAVNLRLFR